ncbi:Biotin synthase [Trichinella pseudospiralis]
MRYDFESTYMHQIGMTARHHNVGTRNKHHFRVSSTPISDFAFFHQEAEDIHCALVVCGTGTAGMSGIIFPVIKACSDLYRGRHADHED